MYTKEEKMNNYVQYIKNALDDAYIYLANAESCLKYLAEGQGAYSRPYADSLSATVESIKTLICNMKEQVEDDLESAVSEEFPIEEEEE